MTADFDDELDAFSRGYLAHVARRLDESVACAPCGRDDYLQELQWNLLRRKPRFDPARGKWSTFVRLVTDHQAAELYNRCLRGHCRAAALSLSQTGDDWTIERGSFSIPAVHEALRIDVAAWMATLEPDEQELCRHLMQSSIAETARQIGRPVSTTKNAISRLRGRFERSSLREYVAGDKYRGRSSSDDR